MRISTQDCQRYATVLLHLTAVEEGDLVLINTGLGQEQLVCELTRQAYERGAKYVSVQLRSDLFNVYRAQYSKQEYLEYLPEGMIALYKEYNAARACVISLRSPIDPTISADVSSDTLSTLYKSARKQLSFFHKSVVSDQFAWIIASYPTEGWAKNVFPQLPPEEGVVRLWEAMRVILRLDQDDCIAAWERNIELILQRRMFLDNKQYHALRITGEGTDLIVKLHERSKWLGAVHTSRNGKRFQANIPTEEAYTSPDCRYTSGTVRVQRPITIFGKRVDGITMTFEEGRVISTHATEGNEILQKFLDAEERNRYIGEIALVDTQSPVWQSNLVFNNILYDENAGVHFALGTAYVAGYGFSPKDMVGDTQLMEMGCNVSDFHLDFTIGYEKLSVCGLYYKEDAVVAEEPIIKDGVFVI